MIIQVQIDTDAPWEETAKLVQAQIFLAPFNRVEARLAALETRLGLKSVTGIERYLWPSKS
jgi:hypothetical protein